MSEEHETPKHRPAKYLVVKDGELLHKADEPMEASKYAQDEAVKEPGAFIDIYHHAHATCARIDPE